MKEYTQLNNLENDNKVLDAFNDYHRGYISDIIFELSDDYSENNEIKLSIILPQIKEYIIQSLDEESVECNYLLKQIVEHDKHPESDFIKQLIEIDVLGSFDYYDVICKGHILYNKTLLNKNIKKLIINYAINYAEYNNMFGSESDYINIIDELNKLDINNEIKDIIDIIEANIKYKGQ